MTRPLHMEPTWTAGRADITAHSVVLPFRQAFRLQQARFRSADEQIHQESSRNTAQETSCAKSEHV